MSLVPLDDCLGRRDVGAKAETLAQLRAHGLPTLAGFVLPAGLEVDVDELAQALAALGGERFAVRSSASVEDRRGASAAGVFESVIGVRGLDAVKRAIAQVRASAGGEAAAAYLAARGLAAPVKMAVLLQPLAPGERLGVARSQAGGFLVEERASGEPEWGDVTARALDENEPLAQGLRAIETLLGGPVDVEYARASDQVVYLQARPCTESPARDRAAFQVSGHWRRDAEHNPEPLSLAQAGLVAFVDELGVGPRQRVLGGYLYVEHGGAPALAPWPLAELRRRFESEVVPDCVARLDLAIGLGDLASALDAFAHVYRRYVGEVAPALARARGQLDQLLRANLGESLAAHGAILGGLGGLSVERDQALWQLGRADAAGSAGELERLLARFGAYAPAWDVAVAADDEAPERVLAAARALARGESPAERQRQAAARAACASHALLARLDRMARGAFKALHPLVRDALPIAEDDDLLFFRAQKGVRRALLSVGRELVLAGRLREEAEVFDLPLEVVRDRSRSSAAGDLVALAAAGRAEREGAARSVAPMAIDDGEPRYLPPPSSDVLRGAGTSGRARGRAWVLRGPSVGMAPLPPGSILVVPALLPSWSHLLAGASALVTDHGGAASHGATLAREYGIPAVLGTGRATAIDSGVALYVDGDAGRVYVLGK